LTSKRVCLPLVAKRWLNIQKLTVRKRRCTKLAVLLVFEGNGMFWFWLLCLVAH